MLNLSRTLPELPRLLALSILCGVLTAGAAGAASESQFADDWSVNNNADWTQPPPDVSPLGPPDDNCVDGSAPGSPFAEFTFPAFSIPMGATLTGIEVTVNYNAGSDTNDLRLTDGGSLVGDTRTIANIPPGTCAQTTDTSAGGDGDLWGTALTAADFNAGSVGVRLTKVSNNVLVDSIQLTAFFSSPEDEIVEALEMLEAKSDALEIKLDELEPQVVDIKVEITDIKAEVTDIKAETTDVKAEVTDVKAEITDVKAEVTDVKAEVTDIKAETTDVKAEVTDIKLAVTDVKVELVDAKAEITDIKAETTDVKAEITDVKAEVTDIKAEITDFKSELVDVKAEVSDIAMELAEVKATVERIEMEIIENACLANERKPSVYLPETDGGQLELVRAKAVATITAVTDSGETTNNAQSSLTSGDSYLNAGQFKRAYSSYCQALCLAVSLPEEVARCLTAPF